MKSRRVLVVDDDPAICEFVEILLKEESYEVTCAPHGLAALHLVSHIHPDIILLDLRMPVMDGIAFLQAYNQTPGPHAQVVVMSAAQDLQHIAQHVGTAPILEKPFQITDLLELLVRQRAVVQASTQPQAPGALSC